MVFGKINGIITNTLHNQKKPNVPTLAEEGIYSPGVSIIKAFDLTLCSDIKSIDIISVPGVKYPVLDSKTKLMNKKDIDIFKTKIRLILLIAIEHKHDCLVLGALGCGAWTCPPRQVAELFKEVLSENLYSGMFSLVTFAIIDTKSSKNLDIFVDVLF